MKKLQLVTAFIILFLSWGCGPAITFNEPQPANVAALSSFPDKLKGDYLSEDGESTVSISDKIMLRTYDYQVADHKDSIQGSWHVGHDTLYSGKGSDSVLATNVSIKGDSIISRVHYVDTLFLISENGVMKKFKGYYFLNDLVKNDSNKNAWAVKQIALARGTLTISAIGNPKDLDNLREITETTDTATYNFSPSPKQFRQFIRRRGEVPGTRFHHIKHS